MSSLIGEIPAQARPEYRMLVVEDSPSDAKLTGYALEKAFGGEHDAIVSTRVVSTLQSAVEALGDAAFTLILADLSLPDCDGLQTVERLLEHAPDTPLIVLTVLADEDVGAAALRIGAQDYVVKGRDDPSVFKRTIRFAVERAELALERKRMAAAAIDHQRRLRLMEVDARAAMVSKVSHALLTPLTVINGSHETLLQRRIGELTKLQEEVLLSARRAMLEIRAMVDDLLRVDELNAETFELVFVDVDVEVLAKEVVRTCAVTAERHGVELVAEFREPLPEVTADVASLRQILVNLVFNALEHTPVEGRVVVSAAHTHDDFVEVCVADAGIGIAPEFATAVFDRHFQVPDETDEASPRGLGLGLTVCRELVVRHCGTIWLDTAIGVGTTAHFTVPIAGK